MRGWDLINWRYLQNCFFSCIDLELDLLRPPRCIGLGVGLLCLLLIWILFVVTLPRGLMFGRVRSFCRISLWGTDLCRLSPLRLPRDATSLFGCLVLLLLSDQQLRHLCRLRIRILVLFFVDFLGIGIWLFLGRPRGGRWCRLLFYELFLGLFFSSRRKGRNRVLAWPNSDRR